MKSESEVLLFTSIADYEARPAFVSRLTLAAGEVDRIVGKYELPSDKSAWAKCGVNNCNTAHRLGFVILKKDGQETNIGHECGERETGESWRDVVATFKRAEDAQARHRTAQTLINERHELIKRAEAAIQVGREQSSRIGAFAGTFNHANGFWRELIKCARQGGSIRAPLKQNKDWNLNLGSKEQLVTVGRFNGGSIWLNDGTGLPNLVERLVLPWLQDLSEEKLGMLDRIALGEMVREAGNKRDLLERTEAFIQTSQAFLTVENIAGLEVICDDVLHSVDAANARPALRAWLAKARADGIPTTRVKVRGPQ
jgi:hypothetical protein